MDNDGNARLTDFGFLHQITARRPNACQNEWELGVAQLYRWFAPELLARKDWDMQHGPTWDEEVTENTTPASDMYAFAMTALEVCDVLNMAMYLGSSCHTTPNSSNRCLLALSPSLIS